MITRNSAKAIIMDNKRLLTIKLQENNETYFILPGGGQEPGENLHETLKRECREEAGAEVTIGDIIFVREYIGKNHELSKKHGGYHQTEFMFLTKVVQFNYAKSTLLDQGQIGLEWIPIAELMKYNFYPKGLREHIINYVEKGKTKVYVGDMIVSKNLSLEDIYGRRSCNISCNRRNTS